MKINLTKREKGLLYALLIIVIFVAGTFFLALPAMTTSNDLNAEVELAQSQLMTLQAQVVKETDLDVKLEAAKADLATQKAKFYADYHAEDVDALLTAMVYKYGMTPNSMSISEVVEEDLYTYEDYKRIKSESADKQGIEATKVKVCNVSMQISGQIAQVQALVDAANANTSLRVSGVSYKQDASDNTMTITFKLYLI